MNHLLTSQNCEWRAVGLVLRQVEWIFKRDAFFLSGMSWHLTCQNFFLMTVKALKEDTSPLCTAEASDHVALKANNSGFHSSLLTS